MVRNGEARKNQERSASRYSCTGALVQGLTRRSLFKSKAQYSIKVTIGGKDVWESEVCMSKRSTVDWRVDADKPAFECTSSSNIQVTLYKNHSSKPVEVLDNTSLSLPSWLEREDAPIPKPIPGGQATEPIYVQLFFTRSDETVANVGGGGQLHQTMEATNAYAADALNTDRIDTITSTVDNINGLAKSTGDIASAVTPLLKNLAWFMDAMDVVTEVHPAAKAAWSVISEVYKQELDGKIQDLLLKMNDTYDLVCDAQELRTVRDDPGTFQGRERALTRLCEQTEECGRFIMKYAQEPRFFRRLAKNITADVDKQLTRYSNRLDALQLAFRAGTLLHTEIVTDQTLEELKAHVIDTDVRKIPSVDGAGYEPRKQCLEHTRQALLDDIAIWASDDSENTERAYILMGPVGTGKSTIAHTVAGLFRDMDRLGASFCFDSKSAEKRTPVDLFRNVSRALAGYDTAFKTALWTELGEERLYTTRDIKEQFDMFIFRPAKKLLLNDSILIMVDGLDQSGTAQERQELISIIRDSLKELPATVRILVTCRAERDFNQAFPESTTDVIVQQMPTLQDDPLLRSDIFQYVQHQLAPVLVGLPENTCASLADGSEGLFQWAAVACQYISDKTFNEAPSVRYNQVMKHANTGLYGLYDGILSQLLNPNPDSSNKNIKEKAAKDLRDFKAIMGFVLASVEPLSINAIATLLGSLVSEQHLQVYRILPFLGSLLSGVGENTTPIRPLHSSFVEFLQDNDDEAVYSINIVDHHERFTMASLCLLSSELHFNMGRLRTSYLLNSDVISKMEVNSRVPEALLYACKYWGFHLSKSGQGYEKSVSGLVRDLFLKNFLFWLDTASTAGVVSSVINCIAVSLNRIQVTLRGLQFLRAFADPIADSASHIYLSAVIWAPATSTTVNIYRQTHMRTAQVYSGQLAALPTLKRIISQHEEGIASVAFSHDGRWIVSGSLDKTIRVWDAEFGTAMCDPLRGHTSRVRCVAFSHDGKRIVSCSADNTIRIWDGKNGTAIGKPLTGHDGWVRSVAFSQDGKRIVSGSTDRTIRIWNASEGTMEGSPLTGHSAPVRSVAFSPDGSHIVSGSGDGTILLWDLRTPTRQGNPLEGHSGGVTSVSFSQDGKHIISGSEDTTVRIWNVRTRKSRGEPLTGHTGAITSVSLSQDGTRIVSGSGDMTIRVWDANTGTSIGEPLRGSEDGTIRVWDAYAETTTEDPSSSHAEGVRSVAFSPDGKRIVSGSRDRTVRVWNAKTGAAIGEPLVEHQLAVASVVFSPNGKLIVSGSEDSTLLAFSPNNKRIASASFDRTIRIWDVETREAIGEPLRGHKDWVRSVAFSPIGRGARIVSGSDDRTVRIWDVLTGREVCDPLIGHDHWVRSVAFSPDGTRIVSGSDDKTIRIWNAEDGTAVGKPLLGHKSVVTSVSFSPDGKRIVSGSADETIRMWDAGTHELIGAPLTEQDGWISSIAFSPDGRWIVSGSDDKTIRVWTAEIDEQSDATEQAAPGQLLSNGAIQNDSVPVEEDNDLRIRAWNNCCFSLSPRKAHQLRQLYDPGMVPIRLDRKTGWILGNERDRILWVPPYLIDRLSLGALQMVIPGPAIQVDLSRFVHGEEWTKCWIGPP
ncbi:WD40 repeat-like protein [Calocera cornea HHB12733]|uniref:WD40 repeat-like protein n=1 Tax=Calocera cornea HHB12733 TaxID=1353952 RepID=A0A165CAP3_9BASI|nr:WD40 repeat-like protein [Calocera cornea HHB12733]